MFSAMTRTDQNMWISAFNVLFQVRDLYREFTSPHHNTEVALELNQSNLKRSKSLAVSIQG